ncbi:hypothetical protein [Algoriphagus formosus]|uniref:hypothetical protein n=1 Tax=Algoriphagus formosus TaxID=2007308 RepID=UPI000C284918|nr:hypothetical protein [Algoriphagus formosus]
MEKLLASMLKYFGIKEFKVDEKPGLTEDQRAEIATLLGEEKAKSFEAYIQSGGKASESTDIGADVVLGLADKHKQEVADIQAKLATANAEKAKLQKLVSTLSAEEEEDLKPEVSAEDLPKGKANVPRIKGIKVTAAHYAEVNHFIKTGRMRDVEAAAKTIDVDNLKEEFGTYLSQNQNNLEEVKALFSGFSSAQYFTSGMAITEWRATQALITSVSQQFTNKWTPSGQTKFEPLTIKNYRHKINMPVIPSEVLESYMLHMYDEGLSVDQMPITKYIWGQLVFPQLMQDIELRMIFKGKFVDAGVVSEGQAGTAPENSMDGLETQLVDSLENGNPKRFKYFDGDGFDYTNCTDQEMLTFMQEYTGWLAPIFRSLNMSIACSYEFWRRYKIAYKNVWGAGSGTTDPNFGGDRIDFSNQVLVPMEGMYGSPILFATPGINLKKIRHKNDLPNVINDVQKQDYQAKLFGEYWLGAGFAYGEAVFAYVPSGYNPKALITSVYGAHTTYQQNKGTDPNKSITDFGSSGGGGI